MKKLLSFVLSMVLCISMLAACSSKTNEPEAPVSTPETSSEQTDSEEASSEQTDTTEDIPLEAEPVSINVAALKGPTSMGMVKLMTDSEAGETGDNNYTFTIAAAIDEITPKLVQGEIDISAVPANLASVLYNNTNGEISVLAINTLGVLYIVESGDTIQSVEDLRGKTIYASGKGATPEYALNYMLTANGIDPETDVTIEYKSEHTECVAALTTQENAIAMLPQPFVTTAQIQNEDIRIALDMTKEWDAAQESSENSSTLITGVVIARTSFIQEHPEAVAAFLNQYQASVEYVNSNITEAASLIETYDIVPAAVAEKALPYCNITFIEGKEMQQKLSGYLNVLLEQNPESIGGALPDEAFYYKR